MMQKRLVDMLFYHCVLPLTKGNHFSFDNSTPLQLSMCLHSSISDAFALYSIPFHMYQLLDNFHTHVLHHFILQTSTFGHFTPLQTCYASFQLAIVFVVAENVNTTCKAIQQMASFTSFHFKLFLKCMYLYTSTLQHYYSDFCMC